MTEPGIDFINLIMSTIWISVTDTVTTFSNDLNPKKKRPHMWLSIFCQSQINLCIAFVSHFSSICAHLYSWPNYTICSDCSDKQHSMFLTTLPAHRNRLLLNCHLCETEPSGSMYSAGSHQFTFSMTEWQKKKQLNNN